MEIKELIDTLRICADGDIICSACPRYDRSLYGGSAYCFYELMMEAAETIESQQKRISELESMIREQEERENTKPLTLEIQNLDLRKIVLRALLSVEYQYTQMHSLMTENVADYICQSIEKSIAKNERNDPLTLDDLRKMDWEPVWCLCKPIDGGNGFWCICKKGTIIPPSGVRFDVKEIPHWVFLRNKPKEE